MPFFFHGSVRLTSLIVPLNKFKTVEILEASNSCPVPTSLVRSHDEVLVKQHRTILVAQRPFLSRHFPLSLASSSAARARVFTTSWSSSLLVGHLTPHFLLSTGLLAAHQRSRIVRGTGQRFALPSILSFPPSPLSQSAHAHERHPKTGVHSRCVVRLVRSYSSMEFNQHPKANEVEISETFRKLNRATKLML